VRYTIKHTIDTDVDTFWKLFFDAEFNRSLFVDGLRFTVYQVLEDVREPSGAGRRRLECSPKVDLPAPARKIFGESVGYTEIGRYDPTQRKYFAEVVPKVAAEKLKTTSETWVEARGDKRCERLVLVDTTDIAGFRRGVAPIARATGAHLRELKGLDDDLESVFRYLVEGR